ncbi:MAG: diaminopropionate ammonia-lyase [Fusobacterium sp.]
MELLKWIKNEKSRNKNYEKIPLFGFQDEDINEVYNFHKTLPNYKATPLVNLKDLSKHYGVKNIWIKDESKRFGLNAFKVLGGSYAMGKYLSKRLNKPMKELPFNVLISDEVKKELGDITFVTATDGNHGRGVAWMANKLRQKSIVYMPKGSAIMRLENIRKEGAKATITDLNYDDAVRLANDKAISIGGVMVQDTAWDGYEEIPLWIMQGYTTIINEIKEQLAEDKPTHVFLQAGVGSFAGAIQGYLSHLYKEERPITVICEPHGANCIYKSMEVNDGNPHNVTGDLKTIMAGLACGEPNTISWKILRDNSDFSVSCEDSISARGMRVLSSPLGEDKRVISGESGSVGLGLVTELLDNKEKYKEFLNELKLNENSKVLCISTEGDTDLQGYKNIVWDGMYSNK